jgi:hypothetical protein
MTLFHSHHDRRQRSSTTSFSVSRVFHRLRTVLKMVHGAIAAAKIQRLRNELMLHGENHEDWARLHSDVADAKAWGNRFPRRPLHLGEKWDFLSFNG